MTLPQAKVLVVDDIADNVQMVTEILETENISVTIARSGRQALKFAAMKLPDLILLDIAMPEMDGYEVCETLKKSPETASIPVIFLTARTELDDIIKGFELGAVDYITKPFNPAELLARVQTHLELKRSRDIINEQNEKLKKMDATKDKLLSIMAYDLRLPIVDMRQSIVQLIANIDKYEPTNIRNSLLNVKDIARKAESLLEKLLEWALIQRGKLDFVPIRFSLNPIINEAILSFQDDVKRKGVYLIYEAKQEYEVFADQRMISFILKNLISNSIKFTNHGGDIIVSVEEIDDFVRVTVYDTGVGMDEKQMEKLFIPDVFYSTKGTAGEIGTGLGLIICKELTTKNGGKIWGESMKGIGSDFKFTIPKKKFVNQ